MARSTSSNSKPKVRRLTPEEARRLLDRRARRQLGISGDEFLDRFRRGEIGASSEHSALAVLAELVG